MDYIIEKYGNTKYGHKYTVPIEPDDGSIKQVIKRPLYGSQTKFSWRLMSSFFREVFLPQGYPESVSEDYFQYQLYDTLQAFCSRLTGTITTKAVLKSVGVGDPNATPLAAAITWILKDGTGMLGSIVFAWWKGSQFDADCKKWRLFADILNDAAMLLELSVSLWSCGSLLPLCAATAMKAGVGVAGSATRAAITQHQAVRENTADVAAKDGSQETLVNLCGSLLSLLLLTVLVDERLDWILFFTFTALHLVTNYCAVSSLVFDTFNTSRYNIVLASYLRSDMVLSTAETNRAEAVLLGTGLSSRQLCEHTVHMGASVQHALQTMPAGALWKLIKLYEQRKYFITVDTERKRCHVFLSEQVDSRAILEAYLHAVVLAAAGSCGPASVPAADAGGRACLLGRLRSTLKGVHWPQDPHDKFCKLSELVLAFMDGEFPRLLSGLARQRWRTDINSLSVEQWRMRRTH